MNQETLDANFTKHGFRTAFFDTKEEAASFLYGELEGRTVAFGGSMSVKEMDLYRILSERNEVIWHWEKPGRETLLKARNAEIYISGVNAIAETGELVNIDGTGNRVSQLLYGPQKIYIIAGRNKICPNLESALFRARNVAAPLNAARLHVNTPCVTQKEMRCYDCNSPERICRSVAVMERPGIGMEVRILFIDEKLGY